MFLWACCDCYVVKLEVTALLFSDVLLVTKVQKKAERLKVVRPPLALDRTRCDTLKDGCEYSHWPTVHILEVERGNVALSLATETSCRVLNDSSLFISPSLHLPGSFVVVEVSVLGCAANVYTFSTSSPESCSTWIFTIHKAQVNRQKNTD